MGTRWTGVHLPAAMKWVRTEETARKYYDDNADQIWIRIDGDKVPLSSLSPEDREARIERWVRMWKQDGWLPYTYADAREAMKKAEEFARKVGGRPVMGVEQGGRITEFRVPEADEKIVAELYEKMMRKQ